MEVYLFTGRSYSGPSNDNGPFPVTYICVPGQGELEFRGRSKSGRGEIRNRFSDEGNILRLMWTFARQYTFDPVGAFQDISLRIDQDILNEAISAGKSYNRIAEHPISGRRFENASRRLDRAFGAVRRSFTDENTLFPT